MSIKGTHILWCSFQQETDRHLSLSFPVSLYIFQDLLDSTLDLLTFACLFVPKTYHSSSSSSFNIHALKELVQMIMEILDSLSEGEPYDFVDVEADKIKVSIKIR